MKWDSDQHEAISTTGMDLCVDAAAGSGKTAVLTERVMRLLRHRAVDLDGIVAVTFTDAAAGEMRERLRRKASEAEAESRASKDRQYWRNIVHGLINARIGTFHSFCASLLRSGAFHVGLDPDFQLLTEAESRLLCQSTVEETLDQLLSEENPAVITVAAVRNVSAMVATLVATISSRISTAALEKLPAPYTAETVARFWETVEEDLRNAVLMAYRDSPYLFAQRRSVELLSAFSSDANEALTRRAKCYVEALKNLAHADTPKSILECFETVLKHKVNGKGSKKAWSSEKKYDECKRVLDKIKENLSLFFADKSKENVSDTPATPAQLTAAFADIFCRAVNNYRQVKRERGLVDFDDLIVYTLKLLEEHPDTARRVAAPIRHLLVDEFQDTDTEQYRIVELLKAANPAVQVFIVGDAKQSIYRFRGAEVEVFQRAHRDKQVIKLKHNYRSAPEIIAFVNHFFASTGSLAAVEKKYTPMVAHRDDAAPCRVEFLVADTRNAEAKVTKKDQSIADAVLIADRLSAMCSGDLPVTVLDQGNSRNACFGDVVLLFRAYSNLHLYERAFQERGIPYRVVTGRGFYERPEIIDFVNMLRVVIDPLDEMALLGFLRSPIVGLSDESLWQICARKSLLAAFSTGWTPDGFSQQGEWERARRLIADLREHEDLPLPQFLAYALDQSAFEAIALGQYLGLQRASNLRKLVASGNQFRNVSANPLAAFVRYVSEIRGQDLAEGDAPLPSEHNDAVTFMTIHKAKGLEFPIVVIPELFRSTGQSRGEWLLTNRLWGVAVKAKDDEGEAHECRAYQYLKILDREKDFCESARLLYVAMTRARDYLLLGMGSERESRSFQEWFDLMYAVLDKADGRVIESDDGSWSAVVRRKVALTVRQNVPSASKPLSETASLRERIAPVVPKVEIPQHFSVRDIAACLVEQETCDVHHEHTATPSRKITRGEMEPMEYGALLHRVLQTWDFREDPEKFIRLAFRRQRLDMNAHADTAERLRDDIAWFRQTDLGKTLLRSGARCRELPFVLRVESALIRGTIDLILADGTLVDYKSGVNDDLPQHRWQLRLYGLAALQLGHPVATVGYVCQLGRREWIPITLSENDLRNTLDMVCCVIHDLCAD